jgi:hypothetical protein
MKDESENRQMDLGRPMASENRGTGIGNREFGTGRRQSCVGTAARHDCSYCRIRRRAVGNDSDKNTRHPGGWVPLKIARGGRSRSGADSILGVDKVGVLWFACAPGFGFGLSIFLGRSRCVAVGRTGDAFASDRAAGIDRRVWINGINLPHDTNAEMGGLVAALQKSRTAHKGSPVADSNCRCIFFTSSHAGPAPIDSSWALARSASSR